MSICSGRSRTFAQRWMVAAMLSEMLLDDLESTGSGTPLPRAPSERLHESSLPSKTLSTVDAAQSLFLQHKVFQNLRHVSVVCLLQNLQFSLTLSSASFSFPILCVATISRFSLSTPCNQLVDRASATRHNTVVSILANSHHHDASRHF